MRTIPPMVKPIFNGPLSAQAKDLPDLVPITSQEIIEFGRCLDETSRETAMAFVGLGICPLIQAIERGS